MTSSLAVGSRIGVLLLFMGLCNSAVGADLAMVVVARRDLAAGHVIEAADLRRASRPARGNATADVPSAAETFIGAIPITRIRRGAVVGREPIWVPLRENSDIGCVRLPDCPSLQGSVVGEEEAAFVRARVGRRVALLLRRRGRSVGPALHIGGILLKVSGGSRAIDVMIRREAAVALAGWWKTSRWSIDCAHVNGGRSLVMVMCNDNQAVGRTIGVGEYLRQEAEVESREASASTSSFVAYFFSNPRWGRPVVRP